MSDAIEREEFLDEQMDDDELETLKSQVKSRRGRGFGGGRQQGDDNADESAAAGGGGREAPQRSVEGWILMVTNVHEEAQEDDVRNVFGEYGALKSLHLNLDRRSGFVKGYALVEFEAFKEAEQAKNALDGGDLLGQTIEVGWAFKKGDLASGGRAGRAQGRSSGGGSRRRGRSPE